MNAKHHGGAISIAAVLCFALLSSASADEAKGRWRFDVQFGSTSPEGRIDSTGGSGMTLTVPNDVAVVVMDPRPSGTFGDYASTRATGRIELHASYGLAARKNSELILDVGVGYYKATIRNVEWSYSFDTADTNYRGSLGCETVLARAGGSVQAHQLDGCTWFDPRSADIYAGSQLNPTHAESADIGLPFFQTEKVDAGTYKAIPVSVDLLYRYRPSKRFNPYLGGGIGYLFVKFDESPRFQQIADQMAGSIVTQITGPVGQDLGVRSLAEFAATPTWDAYGENVVSVQASQIGHPMLRPYVSAPSSLFVQARGGFELQVAPKSSIFVEGRYFWARKEISITADGSEQLGQATPNITIPRTIHGVLNPDAYPYGGLGVYVIDGGLHQPSYDPATGAVLDDGANGQPGEYYFNGGHMKYGGWVFTVGLRFTL